MFIAKLFFGAFLVYVAMAEGITPYSCRLIHAGPIHADLFMPDRFVPAMTDSCPYLFMPDRFVPAMTDSCPYLFMPRTVHAPT